DRVTDQVEMLPRADQWRRDRDRASERSHHYAPRADRQSQLRDQAGVGGQQLGGKLDRAEKTKSSPNLRHVAGMGRVVGGRVQNVGKLALELEAAGEQTLLLDDVQVRQRRRAAGGVASVG